MTISPEKNKCASLIKFDIKDYMPLDKKKVKQQIDYLDDPVNLVISNGSYSLFQTIF